MKISKALLVMDMQMGLLPSIPEHEKLLLRTADAIATARAANIPVIYVVLSFRPGFPEISADNKAFSGLKQMFGNEEPIGFSSIPEQIAPINGDVVIHKKRISAFSGSDLEVVLRAFEVKELIFAGIATSGVILSTFREAIDKDYAVTVLSDCCADQDAEVHDFLMNRIFPPHGSVILSAAL
ncbi:cysteine hydrolase family protein [Pedobacter sp. AW1-32]|uniref:cysteine hydrolase family protein n=1 Tax=Pedobacter sp. AW1-32 TaxID=3383026 RepID=UPI003FF0673C